MSKCLWEWGWSCYAWQADCQIGKSKTTTFLFFKWSGAITEYRKVKGRGIGGGGGGGRGRYSRIECTRAISRKGFAGLFDACDIVIHGE